MGALLKRNQQILDNVAHLADRLREPIRQVLVSGKLDQLARGVDAQGRPYAPLAASTLRQRRNPGPPLGGSDTSLARSYDVDVELHGDGLKIAAGFRGKPFVPYLRDGTRRMPARDPGGFRREDLAEVMQLARKEILRG